MRRKHPKLVRFVTKNPEQKYTVGIRPKWLEDWLKETLGDKVGDRGVVYEQIAKWKSEQQ